MKLLITTGGGGHFSPALAVINELPKDWEVLVVGRKHAFEADAALSLEYQTAQRLKIPFIHLTAARVQRRLTRHTIPSLLKMPKSLYEAMRILREYKPDVVLSFGGYVTVPVVIAASLLKIPIVIHEQTFGAGLANKVAARFASKICLSWQSSTKYFSAQKSIITGNPMRVFPQLTNRATVHPIPIIYITGGSGGAHAINVLVEGSLEKLLSQYRVIHQTGDAQEFSDFDRLLNQKEILSQKLRERYEVMKFVEPSAVAKYMQEADLIISRAGINTVNEILFVGKPCLLIPLPYGQRNEQRENAQFVKSLGLGEVAEQADLTPDSFYTQVAQMIHNKKKYEKNAPNAQKQVITDAAAKIISVIADLQKEGQIKDR